MPIDVPAPLAAFRPVGDLSGSARLGLDGDNQVRQTGTQHRGNIFARAWDFLTRSSEQVQANKAVAQEFVRGIEQSYGKEVAKLASQQLKGQLQDGRPLTASRVEKVLTQAREMAGRIEAGNEHVLERNFDTITEGAIGRAFGGRVSDDVLSPQERRDVVQRAIESDPKFKEVSFHTPIHQMLEELGAEDHDLRPMDRDFVQHFTRVAGEALERAAQAKATPSCMAIITRDGDAGTSVSDEFMLEQPRRLEMAPGQRLALEHLSMQLKSISDAVIDGGTPTHVMLGQVALLRSETSDPVPGGARVRDMALDGRAGEYRDAMVEDMRGLDRLLSAKTGLDKLGGDAQRALLSAYTRSAEITGSIEDGNVRPLGNATEHLARLRADLDVLRGTPLPEDPKARALLQDVMRQTQQTIQLLAACEHAATSGVTREDMQAIVDSGQDLTAALSRIGDTGFHATDIAWLHAQGKPVGEALMRFTPEEARLLRENGLGIDLGLQYKDKGIPIHPRTMVHELRDEMIIGEPRPLTGGALSRPHAVTYGDRPMVFKEGDPKVGYGPQSKLLGIDPGDPRMAVRNVATKAVDELLGFGLVPDTRCATMGGRLGLAMDFAHGASPMKNIEHELTGTPEGEHLKRMLFMEGMDDESREMMMAAGGLRLDGERIFKSQQHGVQDIDFTDPALRRELVKLQLLDGICAQGDRHPGNYIVELDDNGRFQRLRAIDNDQAFGPKVVNPHALVKLGEGGHVHIDGQIYGEMDFNGVHMPPVVDSAMKAQVDAITPEALKAQLTGLLPEKEVEAAVLRLQAMKAHLAKLESQGYVISPDEWGSPRVTELLENPKGSYVGRDVGIVGALTPITYQEVRT